jgi:hypothetical protein
MKKYKWDERDGVLVSVDGSRWEQVLQIFCSSTKSFRSLAGGLLVDALNKLAKRQAKAKGKAK